MGEMENTPMANERAAILLAKEGCPEAFRAVYDLHFETVYRTACRCTRSPQVFPTYLNLFNSKSIQPARGRRTMHAKFGGVVRKSRILPSQRKNRPGSNSSHFPSL